MNAITYLNSQAALTEEWPDNEEALELRGQLLAESASRPALQAFLPRWREAIEGIKAPSKLRWHLEVDPLEF